MTQSGANPDGLVLEYLNPWQIVRQSLADRIIDGSLKPGAPLSETTLANEYGLSRGPIRTALQDLARVGLVTPGEATKRRMGVARFEARDIDELHEVTCGLERIAARISAKNATDDDISTLYQHLEEMEQAQQTDELYLSVKTDLAFHQHLVDMSDNSRLLILWSTMVEQIRYTIATTRRSVHQIIWAESNRPIAEAVAAHDSDAAEKAVVRAFEVAHRRVVDYRLQAEHDANTERP
ncbi:MAG: GntR family transcriptional regulator [Bifidobacteriaceae bacterium]|jgi:DNA-binding GntR family transcriptional regulator|nr:GntR family transcriptional regulator [Bifidobacteriaceae bacterium]